MHNSTTLTAGEKYNTTALICTGWYDGDIGSDVDTVMGANAWDYFDSNGIYQGADEYGTHPYFDHSETLTTILTQKQEAGDDAYLWLHDSGDCMLWRSEEESENDDGSTALGRWQLTREEMDSLVQSGEVDDVA